MPKSKVHGMRLAQAHKLQTLADHLAPTTKFRASEIKMLLIIHQHLETLGPIDRHLFREVLIIVFAITDDVMLDLIFSAFDRNNDNYIDDLEWIQGLSVMLRGSLDQLTDFTYKVYDINGDGGLSREELYVCLKGCMYAGFGLDDDDIEESEQDIVDIAMKKLDNDQDGQITYEDFNRCVQLDALMLQAIGQCLPSPKCSAGFQSLVTDNYHQSSALLPKRVSHARRKRSKKGPGASVADIHATGSMSSMASLMSISSSVQGVKMGSTGNPLNNDTVHGAKAKRLSQSIVLNNKSFSYIKNAKTLALAIAIRDRMNMRTTDKSHMQTMGSHAFHTQHTKAH